MSPEFLLRVDELPGFLDDWVGPVVRVEGSDNPLESNPPQGSQGVYLGRLPKTRTLLRVDWGPEIRSVCRPSSDLAVSLIIPEIRDRLVRWIAERVGLEIGETAPTFQVFFDRGIWVQFRTWVPGLGHRQYTFVSHADLDFSELAVVQAIVPTLSSISPNYPHLDWLVLAAVARHVGLNPLRGV